jgi:hypothetical protein
MSETNTVLDGMLRAAVNREPNGAADTMIINAHLAQMRMFGIRQGLEFYPHQDNFGTQRFDFIQQVIKFNKLDARLDSIWDRFLAYGKGLFYIRPTKKTYRLYWFDKDAYRTYYTPEGELEEVIVIYPYKVKSSRGFGGVGLSTDKRYMRLRITAAEIEECHSEQELTFDMPESFATLNTTTVINTLEFIPCVEVFNNPDAFGTDGSGEFEWIANQVVAHDEMVKNIRANLSFFGNPTLLSSRPKQDIIEKAEGDTVQRPSIASQSGFQSEFSLSSSTYKQDATTRNAPGYIGRPGSGMRVPRVIANLEPTDRVGFITPNAVSVEQARYVEQLRSELRLALGGIDDLSMQNVTATEIKSAYGRVSATAKKKCLQLYTYGVCRCFELMIFQEEQIFRKSLAQASGLVYPNPPEDPEDPKQQQKYQRAQARYEKGLQAAIQNAVETKQIPEGVLGLAPDGDRTVCWRWMGPVYEDTPQDKLNQSIFTRNLQELGVDSIEALKYLFPSKTDDEIAGMLSGFPFRMVGEVQRAYSSFIDLVNLQMKTPHPQQPNLPMAADPRLNLTPFLYRTLESLQKEVTYAGRYRSADPIGTPVIPDPADQLRGSGGPADGSSGSGSGNNPSVGGTLPAGIGPSPANAGPDGRSAPIPAYSVIPPGVSAGSGSGTPGSPLSGESLQGGIQPGRGTPEFAGPIPIPGSTISSESTNRPGQLRFSAGVPVQQQSVPGSADLHAWSQQQPGILQQLFPNFAGNQPRTAPGKRGKPAKP